MSARFGVVGAAADAGDEQYFAHLLQVDSDDLLDYANQEFSSSVIDVDARIPLENDTRDDRDNYYRTPVITFLGDAGWVELTMHRGSDGLIVAGPVRYFIRDGSIADPPVSITGDSLWAALQAIELPEVDDEPEDLGMALAVVARYYCRKKALNTNSGTLDMYDDAGTDVLLRASTTTAGGVQTVGALATP